MSFFNSKIDSDVFDYCVGNDSIRDTDNMNKIKINLNKSSEKKTFLNDLEEDIFLKPYREIYNTSFPVDYFRSESTIEKDIEQKIKEKYYSNPIYKGLLTLDIDLFRIF